MAIDLPHEVALFLNFLGVPYPDIDEDQVRELARQVQTFATNMQNTHESASNVVRDMGSVYSGYSYEALVASWARMSAIHMADLDQACRAVAKALDIAADVITAVKIAVLAELTAMAASYAASMAATAATGGISAALTTALRAAATRLVSAMEQSLIAYLAAEVISKAIEPLEHTIERMINPAVYGAAKDVLDVPTPDSSTVVPLYIEPDEVLRYAAALDAHADRILEHSAVFAENVAALDFTTTSSHADTGTERGMIAPSQRPLTRSPVGAVGESPVVTATERAIEAAAATRTKHPTIAEATQGDPLAGERPGDGGSVDNNSEHAAIDSRTAPDLPSETGANLEDPRPQSIAPPPASIAPESHPRAPGAFHDRHDRIDLDGALPSQRGDSRPVSQDDDDAEILRPIAPSWASGPASALPPEARSAAESGQNGSTGTMSGRQGSQISEGMRQPTSPWQRARQADLQSVSGAKATPRSGRSLNPRSATKRRWKPTPWSKGISPSPVAMRTVSAPDRPDRPPRSVDNRAARKEPDGESDQHVSGSRRTESDPPKPR
ncbi:hypothetical protein [Nocardia abscessus]|uniref:WXG100-like domain-containing protein n=1 Tax=Nocardia abscessus TaxID=120957 RepID=UPI0024549401|nr:hypothetical protein [Nocardia abscessus]